MPASELNTPESPEQMAAAQLLSTGVTAAKAFAPTHLSTYRHGVEVNDSLGCSARSLLLHICPMRCAASSCMRVSALFSSEHETSIAWEAMDCGTQCLEGLASYSGADHCFCCTELLQLGNSCQGAGTSTSQPGAQDCSGQPACPPQGQDPSTCACTNQQGRACACTKGELSTSLRCRIQANSTAAD